MPAKKTQLQTKQPTKTSKKSSVKKKAGKKILVDKTTVSVHKKKSQAPKSNRSRYCKTVCGPEECVTLCQEKPVTGTAYPCVVCGHGHFCEHDTICLSCGTERNMTFRPYKGE